MPANADGDAEVISTHRIERALQQQREAGDYYWMALEEDNPCWLADKYGGLHIELELDNVGNQVHRIPSGEPTVLGIR